MEKATTGFTSEGPEGTFTGHVTIGRCKAISRLQIALLAELVKVGSTGVSVNGRRTRSNSSAASWG